ncbi:IclR family transcriptional regulator [Streptomyces sp. NPDC020801]|uniref:IclR family transcriptional regulator n=1 Tax=unclassified Streptomyces TaxID=2593676 RepID=UPI0037A078CE
MAQRSDEPDPAEQGAPLSSVDNALKVLLILQQRAHVRVSDIASELGVSVSTAHRLLGALVYRDFVEQDETTRAYRIGSAMHGLSSPTTHGVNIQSLVRPYMETLCREVGETVQLVTLHRANVQFVASVETTKALRTSSRVGLSMPAHCSSGGKALLADLSTRELHKLYPSEHLPVRTPRSIATLEDLASELASVRRRGYAVANGEGELDVAAVGIALRDARGTSHAALAVSGPRSRMRPRTMAAIAESMHWVAQQIAGSLA